MKKKRGFGAVSVLRNVNDRGEVVGKPESSAFFGVGFRFGGRRSRNVQSHGCDRGSNPTQGLWGSGRIKNKGGKIGVLDHKMKHQHESSESQQPVSLWFCMKRRGKTPWKKSPVPPASSER